MNNSDDFERLLNSAISKAKKEDLAPYNAIYEMYSNFIRVGFEKDQSVYLTVSIVKEIINGSK